MTPKIADYTSRKSYQQAYAKDNREAINARKKAWRKERKNLSGSVGVANQAGTIGISPAHCPDCKQELTGDEMLDFEIHGRCQSQGKP